MPTQAIAPPVYAPPAYASPTYASPAIVAPAIVTQVPVEAIPVQVITTEPIPEVAEVKPIDVPEVLEAPKVPIKVGKNKRNRTVQILIPCNQTRKYRTEAHDTLRKTSLSTVKNYLKSRKLIKVGSTAPTNLIRQIYENAKSYGDVVNENKQNLLYNFEKDSEEKTE